MASLQATCPYCNTHLPEPAPRTCPRCGEPVAASTASSPPANADRVTQDSPPGTGYSNRAVAGMVLGVMGVMFVVGLAFALWTKSFREKNNIRVSREAIAAPGNPHDLPGLGYLPRDTNLVAAIRPADLVEHPLGKELLAAPRPMLLDLVLSRAQKWTGILPANIDHLVVGVTLTPDRIPPLTLVMQMRRPYDPGRIAEALKSKATMHQGRPLFRFSFDPAGQGYLLCVSDRVIVMALRVIEGMKVQDLDNIPRRPWEAADGFAPALSEVLGRIDKDADAWIAGELPERAPLASLFPNGDQRAEVLSRVGSFAVWLTPDGKTIRVSGALRGRTPKAAVDLREGVQKLSPSAAPMIVHGAPSPAALVVQQVSVTALLPGLPAASSLILLSEGLPRGADALWVSVQARIGVDKLRELMQQPEFTFRAR